jgi:TFIIF-interacting CTD phosphatase-like protein
MITQALGIPGLDKVFGNEYYCTDLRGGHLHTRDLRHFNRSLKSVVVVDYSLEEYQHQPDNVVVIPKFEGTENDDKLLRTLYFLKRKAIFDFF